MIYTRAHGNRGYTVSVHRVRLERFFAATFERADGTIGPGRDSRHYAGDVIHTLLQLLYVSICDIPM